MSYSFRMPWRHKIMNGCIYVFLEGDKDERFFSAVIKPILEQRYAVVRPWPYAQRTKDDVIKALKSVKDGKADYLFLKDIDTYPCITARKEELAKTYKRRIDSSRSIVVVKEIEGWYLAGLDDNGRQELGISPNRHRHTDDLTKEQFESLMPARFRSVADFMAEILRVFRVDMARGKNRSFGYLIDRLEAKSKKVRCDESD